MFDIRVSGVDKTLARHVAHVCVYTHIHPHIYSTHIHTDVCVHAHIYMFDIRISGVDKTLARHVAHLFVRDPLVIFSERIHLADSENTDHFENIQSTNWQTGQSSNHLSCFVFLGCILRECIWCILPVYMYTYFGEYTKYIYFSRMYPARNFSRRIHLVYSPFGACGACGACASRH